ncbi:MAG: hypothetical protein WBX25_16675 [Rhodomicrobium sp.]
MWRPYSWFKRRVDWTGLAYSYVLCFAIMGIFAFWHFAIPDYKLAFNYALCTTIGAFILTFAGFLIWRLRSGTRQ